MGARHERLFYWLARFAMPRARQYGSVGVAERPISSTPLRACPELAEGAGSSAFVAEEWKK
jgi:hypothetical protein